MFSIRWTPRDFSSVRLLGLFFALAPIGSLLAPALARERGPRVEISCPQRPIPFSLDKHTVMAYELHVTNFDDVPLVLRRVQVFADTPNTNDSASLLDLAGQPLYVATEWVGGAKGTRTIEAGSRVVLYLWVELPANHAAPTTLHHRITFAAPAPSKTKESASQTLLEDFPVGVGQEAASILGLPFNGGIWFAGEGPSNKSAHRRSLIAVDGGVYLAERFAIDWAKVGPNGDSHHDGTARNENYWGFGEPILAVADGEITEVVDGIPDNVPHVLPAKITLDNIAGNHVILRVGNSYVTYAHLQQGSIQVHPHDQVHSGAVLARLGNSGQATAPHLHFQVTDRNSVLQSEGLPFLFEHFVYLGPGSSYEVDKHPSVPWDRSAVPGDGVLEFQPVVR